MWMAVQVLYANGTIVIMIFDDWWILWARNGNDQLCRAEVTVSFPEYAEINPMGTARHREALALVFQLASTLNAA
jgi:hypothetical protein